MDFLDKLVGPDSGLFSPLPVVLVGACVVLGTCFFPAFRLVQDVQSRGPDCRPDEPLQGARLEAKITSLHVYPVKSCAGHKVQQATLGDRGLDMDRLWMVVDGRGRFLSQRRCAKMALISPSLPRSKDEALVLSAPGVASLEVPVVHKVGPSGPKAGGNVVEVGIWRDTCQAIDQGDAAASWLGTFLEMQNLRLVRMRDGFVRPTDPDYGTGFRTGFADGFPMLLAAEESLEEINSRMGAGAEAIGMDRFRPNIVVRGWGPFAEDCWTKVKIGGITMHTPKPCSRCQIPQINQSTLEVRNEPRKTMDTFRAGSYVTQWKEKWAKDVFFGMNVLHESGGVLRVGDEADVLRVARSVANSSYPEFGGSADWRWDGTGLAS
ncbi:unnamed protein product [Pylaiella littoralis]